MSSQIRENSPVMVIFKSQTGIGVEKVKTPLFVTDDAVFAKNECARLNADLSPRDRQQEVTFGFEKIPFITKRKSKHPFMRAKRAALVPEMFEKNGNC